MAAKRGQFDGYLPVDKGFSTRAVHAAQDPGQWKSRAVVPPIVTSSNFMIQDLDVPEYDKAKSYQYGRLSNPSREVLEKCIASLDNAKYGVCYSSGMAALSAVIHVLQSGDHVLGTCDMYGGSRTHLTSLTCDLGMTTTFFDPLDLQELEQAITPKTKMIWIESPSNPLVNVVDIRKVAEICKRRGNILLALDNTYLTSYFQKGLDLGAHIVMYSLTKYMNGHSDVIMGAVVTNDENIHTRLRFVQNNAGAVPSPFDCYLVTRGLKTLSVRMNEHMRTGCHVARYLEQHKHVEAVLHPGLESHPQHELFKSQCSGHSGMMAFRIRGATLDQSVAVLRALKFVKFAGSLGGVESLVACPAQMSHIYLTPEERAKVGVTDNLIRLSVGIEDPEDICQDLDHALCCVMDTK